MKYPHLSSQVLFIQVCAQTVGVRQCASESYKTVMICWNCGTSATLTPSHFYDVRLQLFLNDFYNNLCKPCPQLWWPFTIPSSCRSMMTLKTPELFIFHVVKLLYWGKIFFLCLGGRGEDLCLNTKGSPTKEVGTVEPLIMDTDRDSSICPL